MKDESFAETEITKYGLDCQTNPKKLCNLCAGNYDINVYFIEFMKILNNNTNDKNDKNYDLFGWLINYSIILKFNSGEWTKYEEPLQKEIWDDFGDIIIQFFNHIGANGCETDCLILTLKNIYLINIV